MGTDTVRRGGTMGVRINDIFVWLRRSWSKKEVRRVLSLEGRVGFGSWQAVDVYSHCSCLSKTYQLHRYTNYDTSKYISIVRTLYLDLDLDSI